MPKVRKRRVHNDGFRLPTPREALYLSLCDYSPWAGDRDVAAFQTWEEAFSNWQRTREERIKSIGPGRRPRAFWVWDRPDIHAQRNVRESDASLLQRFGLLRADELETLELDPPPTGDLVEFPGDHGP